MLRYEYLSLGGEFSLKHSIGLWPFQSSVGRRFFGRASKLIHHSYISPLSDLILPTDLGRVRQ